MVRIGNKLEDTWSRYKKVNKNSIKCDIGEFNNADPDPLDDKTCECKEESDINTYLDENQLGIVSDQKVSMRFSDNINTFEEISNTHRLKFPIEDELTNRSEYISKFTADEKEID